MKNIKFYRPIWECKLSGELWFDRNPSGEYWFHLVSLQIRKKDDLNALAFTFLGFTAIITSVFISDLLDKYTAPILARNPEPTEDPPAPPKSAPPRSPRPKTTTLIH